MLTATVTVTTGGSLPKTGATLDAAVVALAIAAAGAALMFIGRHAGRAVA